MSNYWPTFTPPQWPGFAPPLTDADLWREQRPDGHEETMLHIKARKVPFFADSPISDSLTAPGS
jgi:hypothetical protein